MTLDEFRERLRQTRTEAPWQLVTPPGLPLSKQIRRVGELCNDCPITVLGGDWRYDDAQLGLSRYDRDEIMKAADDSLDCDEMLRTGLLVDVGLADG